MMIVPFVFTKPEFVRTYSARAFTLKERSFSTGDSVSVTTQVLHVSYPPIHRALLRTSFFQVMNPPAQVNRSKIGMPDITGNLNFLNRGRKEKQITLHKEARAKISHTIKS